MSCQDFISFKTAEFGIGILSWSGKESMRMPKLRQALIPKIVPGSNTYAQIFNLIYAKYARNIYAKIWNSLMKMPHLHINAKNKNEGKCTIMLPLDPTELG